MRVRNLIWMQLEAQLARDDRIVLPLGSTEQHAYLSFETDNLLAERVSVEATEALEPEAGHASWMEGFGWTRVAGVVPPGGHKARLRDLPAEPQAMRAAAGDGSYGGWYERPDGELLEVWRIRVEKTRAALEGRCW